MSNSRSPLKAKALRLPGQSVDEELQDYVSDRVTPYLMASGVVGIMALTDWVCVLLGTTRSPWIYTAIAGVFITVSMVKLWHARRHIAQLKLGRDGERAVGQFLEGLRLDGARVFHDVAADGFNLDHVVLSTKGFYVVETKTYTKPIRGDARVTFSGSELMIAGHRPDRDAVAQTQAGVRWLASQLEASTGKRFPVRGAVVFPGWFVDPMSTSWKKDRSLPWVLEPKALPSFIEQESDVINPSDVALAAYHLARYVRTKSANV